ncbi:formylglycine-generating enzyme family protein [Sorangium sp. So ce1099]|uniref:formylglycine-generating enzyme family protein n=1 Tax=Sorangium sp. So ce1099 TaxID=3133331 RepID=UPI003F5DB100
MAVGAGVALGAVALMARYAPELDALLLMPSPPPGRLDARPTAPRLTEPATPSSPPPAPVSPSSTPPALGAAARPGEPAAPAPGSPPDAQAPRGASAGAPAAPLVDRFAADPAARAACPDDMTLVEGDFCPALPYVCARAGDGAGHGCPEYARGARCRAAVDPRRFCIDRHEWPNRVGELPRVYVDWYEAKSLCASVGKRLCRRSEWILACEGPKRLPYPWGFVRTPSPCNIDRAAIAFDIDAIVDEATREDEIARLWQADPIGSHPNCISAYGAYDLSGNVDEWTDNLADDPSTARPATLNGGYWGPVRNTCRLTTGGHGPTFKFYQAGFRCCADTVDGIVTPPPRPFIEQRDGEKDDVYD